MLKRSGLAGNKPSKASLISDDSLKKMDRANGFELPMIEDVHFFDLDDHHQEAARFSGVNTHDRGLPVGEALQI